MSAEGSRTPPKERTVEIHQDPGTHQPDLAARQPAFAARTFEAPANPTSQADPASPTSPIRPTSPASPAHAAPAPVDPAIEAAITDAYLQHRGALLGYTLRMTRDAEIAEDIVHEAYLRLLGVARSGILPDNVAGWLHRVARNLVIDWARHSRRAWASASAGRTVHQTDDGPEEIVLDLERDSELHDALAQLPDDARRALLLSGAGYPSTAIAAMIGRTDGATRTLLCRARQKTRVLLTADAGWATGAS
jgi:RNA polymerase sigma factor (sigma-70 family)